MRLLLIEDDPHLSELIPKALRAKGFAVDTCELAEEASCALKDGIFDTVILDLGLPDHDGMTVLREMRQGGNALLSPAPWLNAPSFSSPMSRYPISTPCWNGKSWACCGTFAARTGSPALPACTMLPWLKNSDHVLSG